MTLFLNALVHSILIQFVYSQGCSDETGVNFTFYGYPDGDSDTTSFECSGTSPTGQGNNGGTAGGSGTSSDPDTFATAMDNTKNLECEIVYIPYLQKYFRYNDHCEQCNTDFHNDLTHVDLWIGSDNNGGQAQLACEDDFSAIQSQTLIRSPPTTLPVNNGALWDGSTCYNTPSQGRVFPDSNISGICSGGSASPVGGSPAASPSPSSPALTAKPLTPPSQSIKVAVQQQPPAASPSTPTPTTLMTEVATPNSSPVNAGKFGSPGMTYTQAMQASYQGCASWNACLGDPCQTYDNCAGEWICVAGKCTSNLHD